MGGVWRGVDGRGEEEEEKKRREEKKKGNGILYPFISLSIFYHEGIIFFSSLQPIISEKVAGIVGKN